MVGRLIGHDGKQRKLPFVRFGNLSMMPYEPILHPTRGIEQESFVIETRSLSGYSGSPVFVHNAPWYPRPGQRGQSSRVWRYLLGIDWCHLPRYTPVLERDRETEVEDKWLVETNSGMAGVIPAWKVKELISMEESRVARQEE